MKPEYTEGPKALENFERLAAAVSASYMFLFGLGLPVVTDNASDY